MKNIKRLILPLPIFFLLFSCINNNNNNDNKQTYIINNHSYFYSCKVPYKFDLDFCHLDTLGFFISEDDIDDCVSVFICPIPTNSIEGYIKKEIKKHPNRKYIKLRSADAKISSYIIKGKIALPRQNYSEIWDSLYVSYIIKEGKYSEYLITYINGHKPINYKILSESSEIEINDNIYFYHNDYPYFASESDEELFKTYSNIFFSIQYPKAWELIGKLDSITDIFIGEKDGSMCLSLTRFESNRSLNDIDKETTDNMLQHGIKIIDEIEMYICGVPCYKKDIKFKTNGCEIYQESYLLKKGNSFYSIKFGNEYDRIKQNKPLIRRIISSLRIKT